MRVLQIERVRRKLHACVAHHTFSTTCIERMDIFIWTLNTTYNELFYMDIWYISTHIAISIFLENWIFSRSLITKKLSKSKTQHDMKKITLYVTYYFELGNYIFTRWLIRNISRSHLNIRTRSKIEDHFRTDLFLFWHFNVARVKIHWP